ncbi:hypothetical protein VNI00_017309 [Paramarasmius palmivorus]|uniref:Uncharacterized protein n=1 Tax=Paramarasmius palmivorus TaxID=297713 RepID=A0AAW0BAF1_9AGAR
MASGLSRLGSPFGSSPMLQQLQVHQPAIKSPGKPQDLGKRANRRVDYRAIGGDPTKQKASFNINAISRNLKTQKNQDLEGYRPSKIIPRHKLALLLGYPKLRQDDTTGKQI